MPWAKPNIIHSCLQKIEARFCLESFILNLIDSDRQSKQFLLDILGQTNSLKTTSSNSKLNLNYHCCSTFFRPLYTSNWFIMQKLNAKKTIFITYLQGMHPWSLIQKHKHLTVTSSLTFFTIFVKIFCNTQLNIKVMVQ